MGFLSDVATLVKAGYTKEDVKELYNLDKSAETLKTEAQPAKTEKEQTVLQHESPKSEKSEETAPKVSAQPDDAPDYKALYEAEQEKVKVLQNKNNQADVSNNADAVTDAQLIDLVQSFC